MSNDFSACMYVHVLLCILMVGSDRPTMRDLSNFVVPHVGTKWYMLSIQLLDQQHVDDMQWLNKENRSVDDSCMEMLNEWLRTESKNATWEKLIEGLNAPSVKLLHLANRLQHMLLKTKPVCACTCLILYVCRPFIRLQ